MKNPIKQGNIIVIIACICIISYTLLSCYKDEIPIEQLIKYDTPPYDIAVQGGVINIYGKQYVRLTKPTYFGDSLLYAPIRSAEVTLYDGERTYFYEETVSPGEYETVDSLKGEFGRGYTISIEYNGKLYHATDSLKEVYISDQELIPLSDVYTGTDNRVYLHYHRHAFGYSHPSIWLVNSKGATGEYRITSPRSVIISAISYIYAHTGAPLQGVFPSTYSGSGAAGHPSDSVEFIKMSLSDDYYSYLVSVFNLSEWSAGIFSTQPANSYTNLSEGATGFFFASDVERIGISFENVQQLHSEQ